MKRKGVTHTKCKDEQQNLSQFEAKEIFNNVACATSKASDQPAAMRNLIRAFACRSSIL